MLVALAPFDNRDIEATSASAEHQGQRAQVRVELGQQLLATCDAIVDVLLDAVERGEAPPECRGSLASLVPPLPTVALERPEEVLAVTFAMASVPIDSDGAFSASRVFEAYKYANERLLRYLFAHMRSLGLEPVDDMLAMVSTCGWIASAPDAVLAWQTLRSMTLRLEHANRPLASEGPEPEAPDRRVDSQRPAERGSTATGGEALLTQVLDHLTSRDEALRQGRRLIQSRIKDFLTGEDPEARAHALADAYRRLVEGPVRQFGWAMRCLAAGAWTPPPTVGVLSEAFSHDPWLAPAVTPMLLPNIRNGQAHEALEWDGLRGVYVVEGTDVDLDRVHIAVADAMSFTLGCEAALAHWRARLVVPGATSPGPEEPGRMAGWRRAEALFGTNGLRVVSFRHNALRAEVRLERLHREDINPTLQALVHARRLLPAIESFAVFVADASTASEAVIEVSAAALDATHSVWVRAREAFDAMPLAAFLPANLDSRLRQEPPEVAARSAAWIAIDDSLSAIDELPDLWTDEHLWLARTRIDLARFALSQCAPAIPDREWLQPALDVLDAVLDDLDLLGTAPRADEVDGLASVMALRSLWASWGPVPRMPLVSEVRGDPSAGYSRQAARRTTRPYDRWTTL